MSYKRIQDETFPASLLMEFDELDDEFDVSPSALLVCAERADSASGNRSPVLTSNSSSGNYSLSTENENGSGSSSSTSTSKLRSTTAKRAGVAKDAKQRANGAGSRSSASSSSSSSQKRAHSMENLRNNGTTQTRQQQQKYGHVKSKVKQFIDETVSQRGGRHVLVRHKSMPDTNTGCEAEKTDEIDQEMDLVLLKAMLKEKSAVVENLQRHLEFSDMQREDAAIKIESLKRKIEAMRLEESKRQVERDRERQRDQESRREFDRQMMFGAYLRFNRIFANTSTQTSPEACTTFDFSGFSSGDSFDQALGAGPSGQPNASTGPRAKRSLQFVEHDDRDQDNAVLNSETHPESSPDYPLLAALQPYVPPPPEEEPAEDSRICRECAKKKNKKLKKRARLASFFCIKKVD